MLVSVGIRDADKFNAAWFEFAWNRNNSTHDHFNHIVDIAGTGLSQVRRASYLGTAVLYDLIFHVSFT